MTAREILEIAADYADLRSTIALNPGLFTEAEGNGQLDQIASKFEEALRTLAP